MDNSNVIEKETYEYINLIKDALIELSWWDKKLDAPHEYLICDEDSPNKLCYFRKIGPNSYMFTDLGYDVFKARWKRK